MYLVYTISMINKEKETMNDTELSEIKQFVNEFQFIGDQGDAWSEENVRHDNDIFNELMVRVHRLIAMIEELTD